MESMRCAFCGAEGVEPTTASVGHCLNGIDVTVTGGQEDTFVDDPSEAPAAEPSSAGSPAR